MVAARPEGLFTKLLRGLRYCCGFGFCFTDLYVLCPLNLGLFSFVLDLEVGINHWGLSQVQALVWGLRSSLVCTPHLDVLHFDLHSLASPFDSLSTSVTAVI